MSLTRSSPHQSSLISHHITIKIVHNAFALDIKYIKSEKIRSIKERMSRRIRSRSKSIWFLLVMSSCHPTNKKLLAPSRFSPIPSGSSHAKMVLLCVHLLLWIRKEPTPIMIQSSTKKRCVVVTINIIKYFKVEQGASIRRTAKQHQPPTTFYSIIIIINLLQISE
jgi:hypothetical protein